MWLTAVTCGWLCCFWLFNAGLCANWKLRPKKKKYIRIFLYDTFFVYLVKLARSFVSGTFNKSIWMFQDSFLACWAKGSSSVSWMLVGAWDTLNVWFSCSGLLPRKCFPRAGHCHEKKSWADSVQACKNDHAGQRERTSISMLGVHQQWMLKERTQRTGCFPDSKRFSDLES